VSLDSLARRCALLAGLSLAANGVALAVPVAAEFGAVNAAWTLAGLVAVAGTFAAAKRVGRNRVGLAWILWALGAGFWLHGALSADLLAATGLSSRLLPDVPWCLFALLSIAGLAYRSAPGAFSFPLFLLDTLPFVLGVTAVAVSGGDHPESPWLLAFVTVSSAAYALLALVAVQLLVWMASRALNMWIITIGFVLAGAAGLTWPIQARAAGAGQGHWSSALWTVGVLLVALAGFRRAFAPGGYTRLVPLEREHAAQSLPAAAAILGLIIGAALVPARSQLFIWLALAAATSFAVRTYIVRRANIQAQKELARLVLVDPLTELLNRRGLQKALSHEVDRSRRNGSGLHVLLVDVDDFKEINDALGHAVGDVALQEIGKAVKASVRSTDYVARIGGDEFLVLLPETSPAEAERVAERIRLGMSGLAFSSHAHGGRVTASLGLVRVSPDTPSIDELLSQGHLVLREAKQAGKDRVSSQRGGRVEQLRSDRARVVEELQRGGAFRALMQPIVRLADESTVGYELLARSLIEGYELPADLFPVCSEANILTLVDHWCFRACLAAANWGDPTIRYHVNLFPSTLIDVPIEYLLDAFPDERAKRACCVEISEQQIVGDPSYLVGPVSALREQGLAIAVDDVGFGRSSLESLILLEPEVVKVDRLCIEGIAHDLTKLRSLKRLLNVAGALGADVVAEGIESPDDLRALRKLEVDYGQGFLFGEPGEPAHYLRPPRGRPAGRPLSAPLR